MPPIRFSPMLALCLCLCVPLGAEIPLPDAIFYGTITRGGQLVGSGDLVGVVERDGEIVLEVPAVFVSAQGITHYVLRIPMETSGVTPLGSDGSAAREGDLLARLILDGEQIASPNRALAAATLSRFEVGGGIDGEPRFIRGDCNGDGEQDVSDAIKMLLYLFESGASPECEKACDANDDGGVDLADAVLVLGFLVSGASPPSPPYPACGLDPSVDDLLCAIGASGCGVGDGGEVVVKGRGGKETKKSSGHEVPAVPPESHAVRALGGAERFAAHTGGSNEAARSTLETDAWGLNSLLEVTPGRIRMGDISASRNVKTMTFRNRSDDTMHLSVAPSSDVFAISPSRFVVPPNGTFVAFLENRRASAAVRDPSAGAPSGGAGVDVFENDHHLGRIPVEFSTDSERVTLRVGNVAVARGTSQGIALAIEGPGVTHSLVFEVAYGVAFEDARFEPASDVESRVLESRDATSLVLEVRPRSSSPDGSVGDLVLWPREPLAPGTYPVWIRSAGTPDAVDADAVGVVHGEVCAQVPWLDLDGDRVASVNVDVVLLGRFVEGHVPLIPPDWPPDSLDPATLRALIDERSDYFDVNGSGELESDDLVLIDRALRGLTVSGADVSARLRNLYVHSDRECASTPAVFSVSDVQRLLTYLFHRGKLECPLRLDADGDGELSIRDAVVMVRSGSARGEEL